MTYKTKSGDMWDSIAFNLFGDESFVGDLINSNLDYKDTVIFDSGIELVVPDVETPADTGIDDSLPPWR